MDTLKLVIANGEYLAQVWDYRRECLEAGSRTDGCGPLRKAESPEWWLAETEKYLSPDTLPAGKVMATQFLAIRERDNRLVGMLQVRHTLNDYLAQFGGHIGYSVRPSERRKGYAKEMLRLVLPYCKDTLGIDRLLIFCENEYSSRIVLANGGVYECTVHEPNEDLELEKFWIKLT